MESAGFDGGVGGEDSDVLAGGAEDFVDKVGNGGFAGGAGDGDEFHVADGVAVVGGEKFGTEALGFFFEGGFLGGLGRIRFGRVLNLRCRRVIHGDSITYF